MSIFSKWMAGAGAWVAVAALLAAAPAARAQRGRPPAFEVTEATIPQIQSALASGRTTSVALVDAYLARIAAYDTHGPRLNAMIHMNPRARADAAALDAERKSGKVRGPMHGVPIIIKDNYGTVDGVTSAGSIALAESRPGRDAFVVAKLRAAGAIIIGKSNMHELAAGITSISSLGGQTRNAYDQTRCPGGSSGGTGAAIAANFAAVGWGSDTCGSIRIPAAYGSLFGLRPTQGLASRDGIVPLSHTQDVPGPLARTMTDLAIALDVTIGPDPSDADTRVLNGRALPHFIDSLSKTALRGARIGLFTNYFADADAIIADTVRAAVRSMRALGAEVVDVTIPDFETLIAGTSVLNMETKFDLIDYLAGVPNAPVKSMHEILERGLYHAALENRFKLVDTVQNRDSEAYRAALAKRNVLQARIVAVLDSLHLDALAYPTMRQRPVIVGDVQAGSTCNLAAQSGLPALSAPAGFMSDGLPVGLELLGRPFADARLVSMAFAFEQAGPRRRPPPAMPPLPAPKASSTPVKFNAAVRSLGALAKAAFTYDATSGDLDYTVVVSGIASDSIDAVVLRRVDSTGAERVVQRLAGPGVLRTNGRTTLAAADRRALAAGKMRLGLFTRRRGVAGDESTVELPASARH
ncbi:MAG: gatAX [Gemmatimonadetes bacterium]|nr:gatAX [Gemmatimonadota bacterium]